MPASGARTPERLARPISASTMAACLKKHLEHAGLRTRQITFHSFRVGCAVTRIIAGIDIAENMAAVNWTSEKIACRYVKGTKITRNSTGTTAGAAEARYVAANARAAAVNPTVWALFPSRSAPPCGVPQPPTACTSSSPFPSQMNIPRKYF